MHIIVERFVNSSESILDIVIQYHDKEDFLEEALYQLTLGAKNADFSDKLFVKADEAIMVGHKDSELYLLFLIYYISLLWHMKFFNQRLHTIYSYCKTIEWSEFPKELQAYFSVTECFYYDLLNQQNKAKDAYNKAIKILPKDSLRYDTLFFSLISFLCSKGMLAEISNSEQERYASVFRLAAVSDHFLLNYIITADLKNMEKFLSIYSRFSKEKYLLIRENIFALLQGKFKVKNELMQTELLFKIYNELYHANFQEATEYYSSYLQSESIEIFHYQIYIKYVPIHIALNKSDLGMVRIMIKELEDSGRTDYFTDFFRMRLALLENDWNAALSYYASLMQTTDKYKARNRIAFELQFAHELKAETLFKLQEAIHTEMFKQQDLNETKRKQKVENKLELIGSSEQIQNTKKLVQQYADLKDIVYISGETGTGKELVARLLHINSNRNKKPFLAINCAALTESLLESELFGHELGAFTGAQKTRMGLFEAAKDGTLLLDEFGEISPKIQASLLRVLENKEFRSVGSNLIKKVSCKVIVASNANLIEAVQKKIFREDLYYRINRFNIHLCPLRERREDISSLVEYFLNINNEGPDRVLATKELIEALQEYDWPGNIRELRNELEYCLIVHKGKKLFELKDFDFTRLKNYKATKASVVSYVELAQKQESPKTPEPPQNSREIMHKILKRPSKKEARREQIIELFKEFKTLSRFHIIETFGISAATVDSDLKILMQRNLITKESPTNSTKSNYFKLVEAN